VAVRLRALPGIGPWSAQLILLRGLGRLGNFPAGDSGALRGLREVFSAAPDPGEAAAEALERLGDWRGYLYFMLLGRRLIGARG
jgi:3-methyladenine DNA glycosylase/8-oxoguanine DNA glycosylase